MRNEKVLINFQRIYFIYSSFLISKFSFLIFLLILFYPENPGSILFLLVWKTS
jgi:hypothetical protein